MKFSFSHTVVAAAVPAIALLAGCQTSGQTDTIAFDTQQRMVRLDKNVQESVNKLNESTTELSARVDSNDQQTRQLKTMIEDNAVKLENMQRELSTLRSTIARQMAPSSSSGGGSYSSSAGITSPAATSNSLEHQVGGVRIEPPSH